KPVQYDRLSNSSGHLRGVLVVMVMDCSLPEPIAIRTDAKWGVGNNKVGNCVVQFRQKDSTVPVSDGDWRQLGRGRKTTTRDGRIDFFFFDFEDKIVRFGFISGLRNGGVIEVLSNRGSTLYALGECIGGGVGFHHLFINKLLRCSQSRL